MADLFNIMARVGLDTTAFNLSMDTVEQRLSQALQAFAEFTKESIASYATYEQLAGGVNALFGESSGTVLGNAASAHSRLGMSENDYLGNAIRFSATLLRELGGDTEEAARLVDLAMSDIMDNANRLGTSVTSLEYGYKGFARETWLMLDNLMLGYAGTKSGMEELIADAEKLSGKTYDMQKFGEVIEAIHVIQENIGITGTTQLEANTTIEGSMKQLRASYSDFKTAFVDDNKDLQGSIFELGDSFATAAENVLPRVQTAIGNIVSTFENGAIAAAAALGRITGVTPPNMSGSTVRQLYDDLMQERNRRGVSLANTLDQLGGINYYGH